MYTLHQTYTHTYYKSTFTPTNPDLFVIPNDRMSILSNITSDQQEIMADINDYVGGVYIEMTYDYKTNKQNYTYIMAEECSKLYPNENGDLKHI